MLEKVSLEAGFGVSNAMVPRALTVSCFLFQMLVVSFLLQLQHLPFAGPSIMDPNPWNHKPQ